MVDQVSCHKVVIIRSDQWQRGKPSLFPEPVAELLILDDPCPNSECATRETPNTAVDGVCCRQFELPTFKIDRTKEVPTIRMQLALESLKTT